MFVVLVLLICIIRLVVILFIVGVSQVGCMVFIGLIDLCYFGICWFRYVMSGIGLLKLM